MPGKFNPWVLLFALSSFIAALSQMLLKKSAKEEHRNIIFEYLNLKVIIGYGLMFLGMFCCIFAYSKSVTLQAGSVMESIGNLWVMLLSFLCFREPLTRNKILGNLLIIAGIVIFNVF